MLKSIRHFINKKIVTIAVFLTAFTSASPLPATIFFNVKDYGAKANGKTMVLQSTQPLLMRFQKAAAKRGRKIRCLKK